DASSRPPGCGRNSRPCWVIAWIMAWCTNAVRVFQPATICLPWNWPACGARPCIQDRGANGAATRRARWHRARDPGSLSHHAAIPGMEMLHAVFEGALVGARLAGAATHQRQTAGIHAFADFVILDCGLHVGRLLRFD